MYINKSYFIFLILCFFSLNGASQFNVKIGYVFAYSPFDAQNNLQSRYNTTSTNLEQAIKPVHFLNGAHVGFRRKFGGFGIELAWENLGTNREVVGFNADETVFTNKYFYSMSGYSLGFETYINRFGYGTTVERTRFQVKTDIGGIDLKRKISDESKYSSKFYLLYTVQQSNAVALVLKPYFHWFWGEYNLNAYENDLIGTQTGLTSRPWFIGLSLVFYNGRQKRKVN